MALLDVAQVTLRFGGHVALDAVDLRADPGEVTGLIGPNGAGKTTLFNVITGLIRPSAGRVVIDGRDATTRKPHQRARLGLARTFQRLELWGQLTVRENVRVAADIKRSWSGDRLDRAGVDAIIDRIGLTAHADTRTESLPTGQARLVEIGRALATAPKVLLLDEPASGLDDGETEQLGALLGDLRGEGLAVVLVEHDVSLVMATCDRINVLDFGQVIAVGGADEIQQNQAVLAAYLGSADAP